MTNNSGYTRTYKAWLDMRDRVKHHPLYAGRVICLRWQSYDHFLEDMGRCPEGLSLERVDNSKGYSPDNCVWAPHVTQVRNSSRTKLTLAKAFDIGRRAKAGEKHKELVREYGVHPNLVGRILRGESWPEVRRMLYGIAK